MFDPIGGPAPSRPSFLPRWWRIPLISSFALLTASSGPESEQIRSGMPCESGAIWILQPVSAWRRLICSPPLPITATRGIYWCKTGSDRQFRIRKFYSPTILPHLTRIQTRSPLLYLFNLKFPIFYNTLYYKYYYKMEMLHAD